MSKCESGCLSKNGYGFCMLDESIVVLAKTKCHVFQTTARQIYKTWWDDRFVWCWSHCVALANDTWAMRLRTYAPQKKQPRDNHQSAKSPRWLTWSVCGFGIKGTTTWAHKASFRGREGNNWENKCGSWRMEGAGLRIESEGLGMGDGVARRHNIQRFFYVLSIGERSKTLQYTNILLCAVYWAA